MQLTCAWWLCRASTRQARRQPDARRFALVRANRVARADLDGALVVAILGFTDARTACPEFSQAPLPRLRCRPTRTHKVVSSPDQGNDPATSTPWSDL